MPLLKLCIFVPNTQNTELSNAISARESLKSFEM